MDKSTIYAMATASGRAGIAIMRLSGPQTKKALMALLNKKEDMPPPRKAALRAIYDPEKGELLDKALLLWFPAPKSFTGEDMAELHLHGGRIVMEGVLKALGSMEGLGLAQAGDFTRRAFLNGKLDLTQVEALADLMEAQTEAQRRQALRQMSGALGLLYEEWRQRLLGRLAEMEAVMEFPEEDDVAAHEGEARLIQPLREEIERHIADYGHGEILREGLRVALVGAPNVGKSTLLNALARRDAAIVTEEAGTTTDLLEVPLNLGGFPLLLTDMAGLRAARGEIEKEGVRRAEKAARDADVRIFIYTKEAFRDEALFAPLAREGDIWVWSKSDLGVPPPLGRDFLEISPLYGQGLETLEARLGDLCKEKMSLTEEPLLTRARHRESLEEVVAALLRAEEARGELAVEDVRLATRALGRITGRVDVEEVLDRLFAQFCIGK